MLLYFVNALIFLKAVLHSFLSTLWVVATLRWKQLLQLPGILLFATPLELVVAVAAIVSIGETTVYRDERTCVLPSAAVPIWPELM